MSDADSLVIVATFDSLVQAEMAQGFLEGQGIRSFVLDAEFVNAAWTLSGAVGGIKLQVAKSDFLAAERLLNSAKSNLRELDDYGLTGHAQSITSDLYSVREEVDAKDDHAEEADDNEAETQIRAALRAAILGLFLCPPLLHVYSLWLLNCASQTSQPLRASVRKSFWFTAILDAVVVLSALGLVAALFLSAALGVRR